MAKVMWLNQEVLGNTVLFGKDYYWMKDGDGTIYLVKSDEDGNPDYS